MFFKFNIKINKLIRNFSASTPKTRHDRPRTTRLTKKRGAGCQPGPLIENPLFRATTSCLQKLPAKESLAAARLLAITDPKCALHVVSSPVVLGSWMKNWQ